MVTAGERGPAKGAGPNMAWYGLMASAGIVASWFALYVPDRLVQRLLSGYLWLFPCAAMLACATLLRHFFT